MKNFLLWILALGLLTTAALPGAAQTVLVGTGTPNASAALDVQSTTQGMLVPRLTASQHTTISNAATGLLVYQTDGTASFYFYNGTAWTTLTGTNGQGVPTGGTAGQVLSKIDATNYNTQWTTPATGGGASLYTTDGTLSGNRSVGLGGFNLTFSGTGSLGLNDNPLRLRTATDANNLLDYDATTDGPILAGLTGGKLGYGTAAASTALGWSSSGVSINGGTNAYTLPTTRGGSGQTLVTDGSGSTNWATAPGVSSTQLFATKTDAPQTPVSAQGSNTGDVITFNNVVNSPTLGTYNAGTSTYTVGTGGTGTYLIQVHAVSADNSTPNNTTGHWFMVEVNNSPLGSPNNFYGPYPVVAAANFPSGLKGRSQLPPCCA